MTVPMITIARGIWLVVSTCCEAKYVNDIHGNTVVQDKSTWFHVFELHGFLVGVTLSVFMGIGLLICATYLGFKLGLGRVLACCCNCNSCTQDNSQGGGCATQPKQMQTPIQVLPRQQSTVMEMEQDCKRPGAFTVQLVK